MDDETRNLLHDLLRDVWNRDLSADDAMEEIEAILSDVGEHATKEGAG